MKIQKYNYPDKDGFFGEYGGRVVPPQLEDRLMKLTDTYLRLKNSRVFQTKLDKLYREYAGRPSGLYLASNLTKEVGGAKIYLKREDLNHTGAHKINNTLGQMLVAQELGANKLIAETGAGQHGVATATVAALAGMQCDIYMGARDIANQKMNVYRMELLGAKVIPVSCGQGTLKDAVDEALAHYVAEPESYYMLGSAVGPHPYPLMVRDFQAIIGREAKRQMLEREGRLPDYAVACVGGGSNALGLFTAFVRDQGVTLLAAEPAGQGVNTRRHGLSLAQGKKGLIHGFNCLVLQDEKGQIAESYSAASGLDYPGVGPECCLLKDMGRLTPMAITDKSAVIAFEQLARTEGIIPALESAHALAAAVQLAKTLSEDKIILVNLSGRGDKDVENVINNLRGNQ
ncbi:MAG: Tryptophan synthase beta chain [Microgenomates group bacterium GW2011_GWC1_46_16]|uniref:Tryptophan synthase beta chain n=2 Tax=Candidatus Collieribacteriota TaxID=1752725 RepID=A0A1F5FYL9_9BACT|nr:MAG: Tryptophan synthase beta chain [Microgenomates group bacterium GW2011_GWF1_46_12]KKU26741.1 MAG: Tryptophan synthase beta chain [Microgenomates group bacterium GW2011_GWC1_46_16]KKU27976.1 MAG: Tryptophan synthase beta chain [Microgenomates group bacterium GW2011_GWF2_46_18]KKU43261.1 MAG: Tryptophan synthase beta chain [Microgenomates group bacterium GW2011_GWA1_46_7]KKU45650.1 MAG: Tryptophan synthase beta chain [Microgenomates group bacterium GW2011_GWB1_46_7]KKU62223.1 MAG: Tryptop